MFTNCAESALHQRALHIRRNRAPVGFQNVETGATLRTLLVNEHYETCASPAGLYGLTICLRREFLQSEIFPSKDTWHAFDAGRVRLVVKRAVGVSNNRRASVVTGVADKQIQW